MTRAQEKIQILRKSRPRSFFVIWSIRAMLVLILFSWVLGGFFPAGLTKLQTMDNAQRFLGEMRPYPLQQDGGNYGETLSWAWRLWRAQGQEAVLVTVAISVLAMVLAGFAGAVTSITAARNLMQANPFLMGGKSSSRWSRISYGGLVYATRLILIFLRAVPEYVWAFLLLGMYGPTAWPMVLALALHNAGILGKLNAEILENCDTRPAGVWRSSGASRWTILVGAMVPQVLARFMLYFFYRWETCIREATVLGNNDWLPKRPLRTFWCTRNHYDEMLFFIICGVLLIFVGDWISNIVRRLLRTT